MLQRCFFLVDEVEPLLAKPLEMVLIVPHKGVNLVDVSANWMLMWTSIGVWSIIVTSFALGVVVVGLLGM